MPSPDSAHTADAAADGVRLADLVDQLPLSRSSVLELIKVLAITTAKGPGPGGKGRVAWVNAADADRIAQGWRLPRPCPRVVAPLHPVPLRWGGGAAWGGLVRIHCGRRKGMEEHRRRDG
jgi:hypothetical protein